MQLDYTTLAVMLGIVQMILVAVVAVQYAINRTYRGIGLFAIAALSERVLLRSPERSYHEGR